MVSKALLDKEIPAEVHLFLLFTRVESWSEVGQFIQTTIGGFFGFSSHIGSSARHVPEKIK